MAHFGRFERASQGTLALLLIAAAVPQYDIHIMSDRGHKAGQLVAAMS
jgi:hypothetical protein